MNFKYILILTILSSLSFPACTKEGIAKRDRLDSDKDAGEGDPCDNISFERLNPPIGAFSAQDVYVSPFDEIYVTTAENMILRKTGPTWERWENIGPTSLKFGPIHGNESSEVYALASRQSTSHWRSVWRNTGTSWVEEDLPGYEQEADLNGLWVAPSGLVYVPTDDGTILIKDESGWFAETPCSGCQLRGIWPLDEEDIYFWGTGSTVNPSGILLLYYDGVNFTEVMLGTFEDPGFEFGSIISFCGSSINSGYAITRNYGYSFDGTSFTQITGEEPVEPSDIACCPDGTLYLSGNQGVMKYANEIWTWIDDKTEAQLHCSSQNKLCYLQDASITCLEDDSPLPQNGLIARPMFDSWLSPNGNLYLAGEDGLIRYEGEGSEIFEPYPLFVATVMAGRSEADIWIAGSSDDYDWMTSGRFIYHFDGNNWSEPFHFPEQGIDGPPDILDIYCDPSGTCWAAIGDGTVSYNDGSAWSTPVELETSYRAHFVTASPEGEIFVAAENSIHRYEDGTWQVMLDVLPDKPTSLWAPASDSIWLTTRSGTLHYDGEFWRPYWSETYAPQSIFGLHAEHPFMLGYVKGTAGQPDKTPLYRFGSDGFELLFDDLEGHPSFMDGVVGEDSFYLAGRNGLLLKGTCR